MVIHDQSTVWRYYKKGPVIERRKDMDHKDQPLLPLDQRFRKAEQYAFDFPPVQPAQRKPQQDPAQYVCIGNCNICPRCGNSNNRDWAMKLYLAEAITRAGSVYSYFRSAHIAIFGRDVDVSKDAEDYTSQGKIPPYVQRYVMENQRKGVIQSWRRGIDTHRPLVYFTIQVAYCLGVIASSSSWLYITCSPLNLYPSWPLLK